jgi:leucine efflux protein
VSGLKYRMQHRNRQWPSNHDGRFKPCQSVKHAGALEEVNLYGITDFVTFVLGTIFVVLLPGPNSMFVLTTASINGVGAGYRAAAGVFLGDLVLMALAATGAASVLYAIPSLFMGLKYAGAAYLAWIGLGLLKLAWHHWQTPLSTKTTSNKALAPRDKRSHPMRSALMISLLNPKAIFFFISFFIQFVDPNYAYPALTFLLLGIVVQICSMLYLTGLIFGGVRLASKMRAHPRLNALVSGAVGGLFVAFGVKLADATLM